MQNYVNIWW